MAGDLARMILGHSDDRRDIVQQNSRRIRRANPRWQLDLSSSVALHFRIDPHLRPPTLQAPRAAIDGRKAGASFVQFIQWIQFIQSRGEGWLNE